MNLIVGRIQDIQAFAALMGYGNANYMWHDGFFDYIEWNPGRPLDTQTLRAGIANTGDEPERWSKYIIAIVLGPEEVLPQEYRDFIRANSLRVINMNLMNDTARANWSDEWKKWLPQLPRLFEYRWPVLETKFGRIEASAIASDIETAKTMVIDSWVNSNDDDIAELEESLRTSAAIQTEVISEASWNWLR